jgi:hypothetical protein
MLKATPLYHTPELLAWAQDTALRQLNEVTTTQGKTADEKLGAIFTECLKDLPTNGITAEPPPATITIPLARFEDIFQKLDEIAEPVTAYHADPLSMANAIITKNRTAAKAAKMLINGIL